MSWLLPRELPKLQWVANLCIYPVRESPDRETPFFIAFSHLTK